MTPEMTPNRWQQIERLFHTTLECAPEERASFLDRICGDDHELRSEVESLLTAHESGSDSFLDLPAYEVAPDFLADALGGLLAGQEIGPYRILSSLASGGMGEVYVAQDTRLGRKIALKLLPPDFAKDQHRVRRFAQEARAASALNHPNVCVIHEIGKTSDGRHFIAMELIEGITLRERIAQKPLAVDDALIVAEQIAAALVAAHSAGVIHRDIKPENVMLRTDGYVKVLDFGLAKLNERQISGTVNEASTIAHVHTEPGTQMGTVRYMPPEHLRERGVDERADIWSLGVVLHEMVTGTTPFEARTRNEIVALILKRQAARLRFSSEVPQEFEQVVAKALNKNRDHRYQTAAELSEDLRRLRRRLKGEASVEPLLAADQITVLKHPPGKRSRSGRQGIETHRSSGTWASALTYISRTAESVLTGMRRHPNTTIFSGATAVVALLILLPNLPRVTNRFKSLFGPVTTQQRARFQTFKMTPLTNAGQSVVAAISPDGKVFAHVENKIGMQELELTNIANSGTSVVVPPADVTYRGVTFSRDGNYLYFTRADKSDAGRLYGNAGAVYQVSLPGGTPRKIKDGVDTAISFSPTGDRFAYLRTNLAKREFTLLVSGTDGTGERTVATKKDAGTLFVPPSWSRDGKGIVCAFGWWDNGYHTSLIEFDAETGGERIIGPPWYSVRQITWLEDEQSLIVCANEQALGPIQLWRVSYHQGSASRITNDTDNYDIVSISRDGNTMVSVQSRYEGQIWVAPEGDAERARPIASTVGRVYGLDWNSKGRILFSALSGKNLVISSIEPDGSNPIQLTANDSSNYTPVTSPDGRFVVFASYSTTGRLNIWRINAADGSEPRQLTFSDGNSYPSFSPDGQWVLYDNQSNTTFTIWKVPIEGGTPVQLTNEYTRMPVVSPDGQFIACRYLAEGKSREIAIFPFAGGAPIERFPIPVMDWQKLQWLPEGRALTYIDTAKGVSNIWRYDLGTRSARQLTNFKTDRIFAYAWSPDFESLACLRGTESRDVTLVNNQP